MRDARRFSAREVSHGVQRHVLGQTTWSGSTVMAHSGAVPLVFQRLTARLCPADHGRSPSPTDNRSGGLPGRATVAGPGVLNRG